MTQHTFNPDNRYSELILAGCGGTGSQLARSICRVVYDLRRRRQHIPQIHFYDPDRVEEKNVGRQMFTAADVGHYKAEVLASRFNAAMGLNISAHNEPFEAAKHGRTYGLLLFGAVDNHFARIELAKVRNAVWCDAGNSMTSGQVIVGNLTDRREALKYIKADKWDHLPNAAAVFPSLLGPDVPEAEPTPAPITDYASCADLVERGDQHLLVNDTIGIIAAQYAYKLLNRIPLTHFMTFVDIDALSMRSVPISQDDLLAYLS